MALLRELARAKVNLTLDILGRRADGYHELSSLVAFAGMADELVLDTDGVRAIRVDGPFAGRIEGDNILARAVDATLAAWPGARAGSLRLTKALPVAAGLGGGSADAAACLRLLSAASRGLAGEPDWEAIARLLGADVPVCLRSRLAHMGGLGERVTVLDRIEPLPAVLVNPMVPLATADVFKALAAQPLGDAPHVHEPPRTRAGILEAVRSGRNDLEPVAVRLCPVIADALALLRRAPGLVAARLSGSGPTCFGLFDSPGEAEEAAHRIAGSRPDWWVRATALA